MRSIYNSIVEFDILIHDLMLKYPDLVYKDNGLVLIKLTTETR